MTVDEAGGLVVTPARTRGHTETGTPAPHPPVVPPRSGTGAAADPTGAGPGLSVARPTGPVPNPELPEGRVEVRIVRDATGRVEGAYTAHHPRTDQQSIDIHDIIARLLRQDHEQLGQLLQEQARAFGGGDTPLALQLELKKLFDEAADVERRLLGRTLSRARSRNLTDKLDLLREHIADVRAALADPTRRAGYQPDVVGVPTAPKGMPEPPDGHIYFLRSTGRWDLRVKGGAGPRPIVRFGLRRSTDTSSPPTANR